MRQQTKKKRKLLNEIVNTFKPIPNEPFVMLLEILATRAFFFSLHNMRAQNMINNMLHEKAVKLFVFVLFSDKSHQSIVRLVLIGSFETIR